MARVTGIGGFFFRSRDPETLNRWYGEHFGVIGPGRSYEDPGWFMDRGECVFSAFPADSEAFVVPENRWKINFRVEDIDGLVARLQGAGIEVVKHDRVYPNGRFAELLDPGRQPDPAVGAQRGVGRARPRGVTGRTT